MVQKQVAAGGQVARVTREQRWVLGYYNNPIYSSFYYYALAKQ